MRITVAPLFPRREDAWLTQIRTTCLFLAGGEFFHAALTRPAASCCGRVEAAAPVLGAACAKHGTLGPAIPVTEMAIDFSHVPPEIRARMCFLEAAPASGATVASLRQNCPCAQHLPKSTSPALTPVIPFADHAILSLDTAVSVASLRFCLRP